MFEISGSQLRASQLLVVVAVVVIAVAGGAFIASQLGSGIGDGDNRIAKYGVAIAILAALPTALFLFREGLKARLGDVGLILISTVLVVLMAWYFAWAIPQIQLPADVLIWSESDFVNDILKFRQGYPIFTPEVNNESFTYVPGTQLTTYFLAWSVGQATSISAYRAVQVFYTLLTAFFALLCCRSLVSLSSPAKETILGSNLWVVVWFAGSFLMASNSITNPFVHLLHNDSLAQLAITVNYWLLLKYETTGDRRILWLMAIVPAFGFWIKQSLIVWAVIYCLYVWLMARSESRRTLVMFAVVAFGSIAISIGIGWLLWGEDFRYWVFTVLGAHGVSPVRSFKHVLDVWIYFVAGLAAGMVILAKNKRLIGLWLVWLFLILTETYTSGIAWMLNHIGPGTLLAGVWLFAALALAWNSLFGGTIKHSNLMQRLQAAACLAVICLAFNGLGIVRAPIAPFGNDAYRYIGQIEKEFQGTDSDRVLLDFGTWTYFPQGTVMKDRAPSIGERGYSQTGDFSGIISRLSERRYDKILVRNLHSGDFWYDHEIWTRSSNIREALLSNYKEVGTIEEVSMTDPSLRPYGFNRISVLIPRTD